MSSRSNVACCSACDVEWVMVVPPPRCRAMWMPCSIWKRWSERSAPHQYRAQRQRRHQQSGGVSSRPNRLQQDAVWLKLPMASSIEHRPCYRTIRKPAQSYLCEVYGSGRIQGKLGRATRGKRTEKGQRCVFCHKAVVFATQNRGG